MGILGHGYTTVAFSGAVDWERIPGGFIVKDANGQSLAYIYSDNRQVVNTLTEDEARRIASNIAKVPEFLGRQPGDR